MRRLLKEPLLHFILLGAGIFLAYSLMQRNVGAREPGQIVVTLGQIEQMAAGFTKTWQRPPTPDELAGLVRDRVREEVYCREALALGLDREDTVIRRRLRQKMEFVTDDVAGAVPPTDVQLQQYLDAHKDKFVRPALTSFEQVFLSRERRGDAARKDAERLLAELRAKAPEAAAQDLGDATLLPARLEDATTQDIGNTFGTEFAAALADAPLGQWSGPVQSGYGLHLVRVNAREAGSAPSLDAVRPLVQREWEAEQRKQAKDALLAQLLSKYEVRVEGPLGEALRKSEQAQPAGAKP